MSARLAAAALAAALAARGAAGAEGVDAPPTPWPDGSQRAPAASDPQGSLVDPELEAARIAWRYFERNYQPATGFVNSVEGYASTTM